MTRIQRERFATQDEYDMVSLALINIHGAVFVT